jgi:GntR family transcriptional regulator/MocR family aminotransferase
MATSRKTDMTTGASMKRAADGFLLPIPLDNQSGLPVYRQLYGWIRDAILAGTLRPGQRMPSTRAMAGHLRLSRIPVLSAYEQLLAEGYLETFVGVGTCVAHRLPDDLFKPLPAAQPGMPKARGPRRLSRRGETLVQAREESGLASLGAFRVSLPALDHFPLDLWHKLVTRHSRALSRAAMAYGATMGLLPFREAVADYLGASRAVRCDASQILVTTGSQQALQLCAHVLLDARERICIEEPGYPGARNAFLAAGAEIVPVRVDSDGLDPSFLPDAGDVRAVYVTPSHQYPLGRTMSAARRLALLQWAEDRGAWIVEDDYDSEYRFASRPIGSLQGIDTRARVIYVGTFSKVMFPALRLGYMVIPPDLVPAFAAAREAADNFSPTLYQLAMTDFMREGHFGRHVRRMRMLYMERRLILTDAIRGAMPDRLEIIGSEAGMHLVALLPEGIDDNAVAKAAFDVGLSVIPLSSCCAVKPARGGLILGYGGVNEAQIRAGVAKLAACVPFIRPAPMSQL